MSQNTLSFYFFAMGFKGFPGVSRGFTGFQGFEGLEVLEGLEWLEGLEGAGVSICSENLIFSCPTFWPN